MRRFFDAEPNLEPVMPLLLKYGDAKAREFVVRVASLAELPSIFEALREFTFGRRGADELRHQAAMVLVEAGVLAPGEHRLWWDGELRDLLLLAFEISPEATDRLPADVEPFVERAQAAIHEGNGRRAEMLFDEALRLHPDLPTLTYNRAVAIGIQGRAAEAMRQVRELHRRHPNYLFARTRIAEEAIERRDFGAARALLDPLLSRKRFHLTEYVAICHAHIALLTAEGKVEGAQSWLQMWERVAPDDPRLMHWKSRLNRTGLLGKLFRGSAPR
jgi:tetratricopeptide (TPR) repeat protein